MRANTRYIAAHQGFTLLELLIGITLLSLLMVLLSGSVYFANRLQSESLQEVSANEDIRQAYHVFHQYLAASLPVWKQDNSNKELLFSGEASGLTFAAVMPPHLGVPGLYEITFSVVDGYDDTKKLLFNRQLLNSGYPYAVPEDDAEQVVVLSGVSNFDFSYFDGSSNASAWSDEWLSRSKQPELVRMRAFNRQGDVHEFIVKIMPHTSTLAPILSMNERLQDFR